jgi:hexosaminidase
MSRWPRRFPPTALALAGVVALSMTPVAAAQASLPAQAAEPAAKVSLIPAPAHLELADGAPVELGPGTVVKVHPRDRAAAELGAVLGRTLSTATANAVTVGQRSSDTERGATIRITTRGDASLGKEGYTLDSAGREVVVTAAGAEGLFRGLTTLRQLLPPEIEAGTVSEVDWAVPSVHIKDAPRYDYRGAMLDVGRRFYPVEDVKRFIDQMAMYKLNTLHMHLTEDQGWRLTVDARPELTAVGGNTQSGFKPGTGGPWFYTKADYQEIVAYADEHFIDVLAEVDGPSHATAAKASIPEINCDGKAVAPYSGFDVGLPTICLAPERRDEVRAYLKDVLTEAAQQSSSDIVHIGGDEVPATTQEQMDWYVKTASEIVTALGKRVMGWHQIGASPLAQNSIMQWWADAGDQASIGTPNERPDVHELRNALAQGAKVVTSPADRSYLDMKYDSSVPYGLSWAGYVDLERAYNWDPISVTSSTDGKVSLATEDQIAGVEASLWADRAYRGSTSLPTSLEQFIPPAVYTDFMAFPRMPAIAEIGWSPAKGKSFDEFEGRVVEHALRWEAAGIGYYRAPDVPWHPLPVTLTGRVGAEPAGSPDATTPVTVRVPLANNTPKPQTVRIGLRDLGFWRAQSTSLEVVIPPDGTKVATVDLFPDGGTGWSTIAVDVEFSGRQVASERLDIVSGGRHVSDWDWTSQANGWGPAERDLSNGEDAAKDGRPLTIQGRAYGKGIGAHAPSTITLDLAGGCQRFQSDVGVDDEVAGGSVRFRVLRDGVQAWASSTKTGSATASWVDLDVSGVNALTLVVDDAGDGNAQDHADWAGAWLRCTT